MFTGGVKLTIADPLLRTAVTPVGASGTVAGVTEFELEDATLSPTAFVATTVNVYTVPFESPVIVIGEEPPVALNPPMLEVTVYEVIAEPPLLTGAVKLIVAWPLPATAVTPVGASGTVAGTTEFELADAILSPSAFVATTVNV